MKLRDPIYPNRTDKALIESGCAGFSMGPGQRNLSRARFCSLELANTFLCDEFFLWAQVACLSGVLNLNVCRWFGLLLISGAHVNVCELLFFFQFVEPWNGLNKAKFTLRIAGKNVKFFSSYSTSVTNDVYKWRNKDGNLIFSNQCHWLHINKGIMVVIKIRKMLKSRKISSRDRNSLYAYVPPFRDCYVPRRFFRNEIRRNFNWQHSRLKHT